ncbi:type II toxin-antitoxin system death-on-curing family toxin [Pseudomonas syringae]|uniref:type II toxin-antitoxin system death-on-curing family toxin n=1 Tax=Pseudomonas syringae TaxID=317 RepID=UPI0015D36AC9|nr:type II toxin-antitoxin system death-on-curing family toxin [Pseudomonas syringae]
MVEKSNGIRYLSVEDLSHINERLIAMKTPDEISGVFSFQSLETAQQSAEMHRWYGETEDIFRLAAVFFESLARNHPFHNANKRTAAVATSIFLLINGFNLETSDEELVEVAVAVVKGDIDRDTVEDFLYLYSKPFDDLQYAGNEALRRLLERKLSW